MKRTNAAEFSSRARMMGVRMTKKIRVFLAPHAELKLHVSDWMLEDYKACICRSCENCSWNDVRIGNTALCGLADIRRQLDQKNKM